MPQNTAENIGNALSVGSGALSALYGVASSISGLVNLRKDKQELARLSPAYYKIQNEYYQNRNTASQMAGSGLPQGVRDYETSEVERGLGAAVSGELQTGGTPNDIAKAFDIYGRHINRIGAEDASAHVENIKYFMGVNKELAGQKNIQWGINEYAPYQNKLKELTARIAADKENVWGGAGTFIGGLGATGTSLTNASLMKSLFQDDGDGGAPGGAGQPFTTRNPVDLPSATDPSGRELQNPELYATTDKVGQQDFDKWFSTLPPQERSQYLNNFYGKK